MAGLQKLYFGIADMTPSRSLDDLMRVVQNPIRLGKLQQWLSQFARNNGQAISST
jgi:hypothetical protein